MIGHPAPGSVIKARAVPRIMLEYPVMAIKEKITAWNIDTVIHPKTWNDLQPWAT
jgi:hypothetical protein